MQMKQMLVLIWKQWPIFLNVYELKISQNIFSFHIKYPTQQTIFALPYSIKNLTYSRKEACVYLSQIHDVQFFFFTCLERRLKNGVLSCFLCQCQRNWFSSSCPLSVSSFIWVKPELIPSPLEREPIFPTGPSTMLHIFLTCAACALAGERNGVILTRNLRGYVSQHHRIQK